MLRLSNCRKLTLGFVALSVALGAGVYVGIKRQTPATGNIQTSTIEQPAINALFATKLPDAQGKERNIQEWQGKTLVVNFWATWCQPCREEMPAFSRLQTKYADNNVQFIGIAVDSPKSVADFSEKLRVDYPLLIAETTGGELMRQLGNTRMGLPYTVVLTPTGTASLAHLGKVPEALLDGLLSQSRTTP